MEDVIFRIDKPTKNKLKAQAALEGKSMTKLLGELVTKYLFKKEIKEA